MSNLLICDNCGRLHVDDDAALSESCVCGRFKTRMEWASDEAIKAELNRLYADEDREALKKLIGLTPPAPAG